MRLVGHFYIYKAGHQGHILCLCHVYCGRRHCHFVPW